jgi:hypothetical protein
MVGHLGLSEVSDNQAQLDNVMRSPIRSWPQEIDLMKASIDSLAKWASQLLGIERLWLFVRSDNTRAISLYQRSQFSQSGAKFLRTVKDGDTLHYVDSDRKDSNTALKKLILEREMRKL